VAVALAIGLTVLKPGHASAAKSLQRRQGQVLRHLAGTTDPHDDTSGNSTHDDHAGIAHDDGHDGEHMSGAFYPVIFFLITYFLSALSQSVVRLIPENLPVLPHSVVLFLLGMGAAWLAHHTRDTEYGQAVESFTTIDPHIVFWVLLPALLYEDAAGSHWHVIKRVLPSALLLAGPGVILNTVMTGTFVRYCMSGFEWKPAMLLGSMLSATDPVAVVGALQSLGAPLKLSSLISGEALFNDGTAVALFQISLEVAAGEREFEWGYSIKKLLQLALGGPLLGLAFALLAFFWLRQTRSFQVEMLVIVVCVYGSFFLAEHGEIHVSGVLAVVAFGFFMSSLGHFALDVEREHDHHAIIGFLAMLSNEAIFVISGVVGHEFLVLQNDITIRDWLDLAFLFVAVHVTRTLVIVLGWPLLTHFGYGLTWKEAVICVHGGLRGAVGLALALQVNQSLGMEESVRAKIAFHTSGIVLGTLILNATTISALYRKLRIYHKSEAEHHYRLLKLGLQRADGLVASRLRSYKQNWFFHNCDLDIVDQLVPKLKLAIEEKHKTKSMKLEGVTEKKVSETLLALAKRVGTAEPDRVMRKVRVSKRKHMSGQNLFLLRDITTDLEDVGMEMAMGLANMCANQKRSTGRQPSFVLNSGMKPEVSVGVEAMRALSPNERARRRWRKAFYLAQYAQHEFAKYRDRTEHFVKSMEPTVRTVALRQQRGRTDLTEFDILSETFQMVVNASCADLKAMWEARSLSDMPFHLLTTSMEYMEEALHGDLKPEPFLLRAGLESIFEGHMQSFRGKPWGNFSKKDDPHFIRRQMMASYDVAWASIQSWMGIPKSRLLRVLLWLVGDACMYLNFRVLKRDVEMILAFIMVSDHIATELGHLEHMAGCEEIRTPLRRCKEQAKGSGLQNLYDRNRPMFILFEHILCARLVLRHQHHLVQHLAEEGAISERDALHLLEQVIEPTEDALSSFSPRCPHMIAMGCEETVRGKASPMLDRLLQFAVRYLILSPGVS